MNRAAAAWLDETVPRRRTGLKGPNAARLLERLGMPVPATPNSWAPLDQPGDAPCWNVVCRLGHSEFFVEEAAAAPRIAALEQAIALGDSGAWPVLREDAALWLGGTAVHEVLAQVCNLDFASCELDARPVYMTLAIGTAVLVLPQNIPGAGRCYRIWCDPSFGPYLRIELEEIVKRISTGRVS